MAAPVFTDGVTPLNAATFNALGAEVNTKLAAPAVVNGQWIKGVGGAAVWSAITPSDIAGYPADATKVLKGDGTWGVIAAGQKFTTSTLAAGPPGSPADGDIWIATGVGVAFQRWQFQYDAGESTAYKWKFIGGPPVATGQVGNYNCSASGAWQNASGLGLQIVRAGFYQFRYSCICEIASAGGTQTWYAGVSNIVNGAWSPYSYDINGLTGSSGTSTLYMPITGTFDMIAFGQAALAAASNVYLVNNTSATSSGTFVNGYIDVIPIKIS